MKNSYLFSFSTTDFIQQLFKYLIHNNYMKNLNKEIILEILYKQRFKIRNFGVKKLILFGSFARDEQNEKSDLDFLVEFEEGRGLFRDYVGLLHLFEDTFERKIDLVKPDLVREELKEYILGGVQIEARV